MTELPFDPKVWLTRVELYESIARLSAASAFGISLVLAALVLRRGSKRSLVALSTGVLSQTSRVFFLMGLFFSVFLFALIFASPVAPVSSMMSLGIVCLLTVAVLALNMEQERLTPFIFVSGSLAWLLLVLTPFLYPLNVSLQRNELSHLGQFHVLSAIVASSLFVLAVVTSVLYLFVHRRLRSKDLLQGWRLPGLDSLDTLVDRFSFAGLLVMTASLLTGLVLIYQGYSLGDAGTFKIFWAFGVWIWYVLAIYGRAHWGWQGKRGASASLVGGALLGFVLFGSIWS